MSDSTEHTHVTVVGSATVVPEVDQDTACLLVNDDHMIDTGWNGAMNMIRYGADPLKVDYLFITHCHHDHYIGLPQLLFVHAMRRSRRPDRPPLTVIGPKPEIGMVVDRALSFLRAEQFPSVNTKPQVVALQAGESFTTPRFEVTTAPTVHPVVGLCYRFRDLRTDASLAVTGDTAYRLPLADHVRGVDLLVHEASRGACASDPNARNGHSGSIDAARIALAGEVGKLGLIHYPSAARQEILAAACEVFPETVALQEGDRIELC
ncbi:MAG: MBL fold metallo-hydrolase [Victivallales bacterium]|jgi:ribonuclease Z|nr:MBL fold metallo-hydrolase [Victivallales bacterium]